MITRTIRHLLALSLLALMAACGTQVQVTSLLNSTEDVKNGDPVFLQEKIVGEVADIAASDGRIKLTIELNDLGLTTVMQEAALVINRLKPDSPLEIYNRQGSIVEIQDGDQLQGLDSMFQLGAWMVGDSINVGMDGLNEYVSAFQRYLDSEQWRRDTQVIEDQAEQTVQATEETVKQLTQNAAKATEKLYQAEQQAADAVDQLGQQLKPVVEQLASSSDEIVQELERLVGVLNEQVDEHQPLGSQFADSLLGMMETLGKTFEQPASEDNDEALQLKLDELEKTLSSQPEPVSTESADQTTVEQVQQAGSPDEPNAADSATPPAADGR